MVHNGSMKQVELNTICSAFAGLSERLSVLHRLQLDQAGVDANLPVNLPLSNVAKALAEVVRRSQEPKYVTADVFRTIFEFVQRCPFNDRSTE